MSLIGWIVEGALERFPFRQVLYEGDDCVCCIPRLGLGLGLEMVDGEVWPREQRVQQPHLEEPEIGLAGLAFDELGQKIASGFVEDALRGRGKILVDGTFEVIEPHGDDGQWDLGRGGVAHDAFP